MSAYPVRSDVNQFTGRHTIHVAQDPAAADPAAYAACVEAYIAEHRIAGALLTGQSPATAAALAARPGFTIVRSDWEYARGWPSGESRPDIPGLRRAESGEAEVIARIINAALEAGPDGVESAAHVRERAFQPGWFNALVTEGGRDVAYGNAIHDGADGTIGFLCVLPEAQGRGLGRRLCSFLLAELDREPHERITLVVEQGNARAIRLYESFGFTRTDGPYVQLEYRRVQ